MISQWWAGSTGQTFIIVGPIFGPAMFAVLSSLYADSESTQPVFEVFVVIRNIKKIPLNNPEWFSIQDLKSNDLVFLSGAVWSQEWVWAAQESIDFLQLYI